MSWQRRWRKELRRSDPTSGTSSVLFSLRFTQLLLLSRFHPPSSHFIHPRRRRRVAVVAVWLVDACISSASSTAPLTSQSVVNDKRREAHRLLLETVAYHVSRARAGVCHGSCSLPPPAFCVSTIRERRLPVPERPVHVAFLCQNGGTLKNLAAECLRNVNLVFVCRSPSLAVHRHQQRS